MLVHADTNALRKCEVFGTKLAMPNATFYTFGQVFSFDSSEICTTGPSCPISSQVTPLFCSFARMTSDNYLAATVLHRLKIKTDLEGASKIKAQGELSEKRSVLWLCCISRRHLGTRFHCAAAIVLLMACFDPHVQFSLPMEHRFVAMLYSIVSVYEAGR